VLGCYGGQLATPNLERLARRGVTFTNATCTTPFCSPSRASLITGLYPHRHGIVYNVMRVDYPSASSPPTEEGITPNDVTTEGLLNAAGYATHQYGKWHLSDPAGGLPYYPDMYGEHREYEREMAEVFHKVRDLPRAQWMNWYGWALPIDCSPSYQKVVNALGNRWEKAVYAENIMKAGRLKFPLEQVFDVRVAERTIERLRSLGPHPFMVTCSFNKPHDPEVLPSPYFESFVPDHSRLPANRDCREARFEKEWSRRIVADLGEAGLRELLGIYRGSIRLVDDQVGRVLDALEMSGRYEDTIVVFTADHGGMAGGHGMYWKATTSFYDEVVRIPLLISFPGRINPGQNPMAASLVDIMPTLLDLVGQPIPEGVQGHSLAPYLLGKRDPATAPPYRFCERVNFLPEHTRQVAPGTPGSFMVRGRGWKYVQYPDGEEFLYHLAEDPGETRNLAKHTSYADQKNVLRGELETWLNRTGMQKAP
jgi:arylsulfatase A-like enzyme